MNYQAEQIFEEKKLAETKAIASRQLEEAKIIAEEKKEGITEAKKEVFENAAHGFTNLYNSDDFEALVELSQLNNPITESIEDYEEVLGKIHRLELILKNPYFARIDFRFEDEEAPEQIYIGRSSLREKTSGRIEVYDWRSPIASVFYRFMTGAACYDVPGGRIEGEVTLKRQYEIKDGKLQYFFDADRNISDEFLRQLLSRNASMKMKAVVETIQKEQDEVIRDMNSELLMVQGIAGSGKTSIALHRAAYLMYQGLQQSQLSADNILIISPNAAFEQYISDVLPELGEKNVNTIVFEDILKNLLKGIQIQPKNEFLERVVTFGRYQELMKASMEFKTSKGFQDILDRFLQEIPLRWMEFEDIFYHEKCVLRGSDLRNWVLRRPDVPLGVRLEQLTDYVLEQIFGTARGHGYGEEHRQIREQVQKLCSINIVELYGKLFLKKEDTKPELAEIAAYTRENLQGGCLYYDDAMAVAYLHLKFHGTTEYRNIRQVVIDEAQDYYPLQYEIFRMLFSNAKFTVLGDINQTLEKTKDLSLYQQIQKILNKKTVTLITLNKSFRCTREILNFSRQFLEQEPEVESFNRSGDLPELFPAENRQELLSAIRKEVEFCKKRGLKTICLLCKTQKNASQLYQDLKSQLEVHLIKGQDTEGIQGTFIMPVYMSKGLEFDTVLICDADDRNYCEKDDKNLLYVGCTRALHRLSLLYEGKGSRFLND